MYVYNVTVQINIYIAFLMIHYQKLLYLTGNSSFNQFYSPKTTQSYWFFLITYFIMFFFFFYNIVYINHNIRCNTNGRKKNKYIFQNWKSVTYAFCCPSYFIQIFESDIFIFIIYLFNLNHVTWYKNKIHNTYELITFLFK